MEQKIIEKKSNPFLHREELIMEIVAESNPSIEDVKKAVGKDEGLITVKKIGSNFGRNTFTAEIFVYESKELKDKVEKPKQDKKAEGESPEAPAAPAAPVEAPKAEEKTEEAKPEEKKE
jgi:ribosomal protein S24E